MNVPINRWVSCFSPNFSSTVIHKIFPLLLTKWSWKLNLTFWESSSKFTQLFKYCSMHTMDGVLHICGLPPSENAWPSNNVCCVWHVIHSILFDDLKCHPWLHRILWCTCTMQKIYALPIPTMWQDYHDGLLLRSIPTCLSCLSSSFTLRRIVCHPFLLLYYYSHSLPFPSSSKWHLE